MRTLQGYLAKDLIKATLLSLVVFTLIMTVIAVIEPLREQGLSSGQALALFSYSIPVMISLTLPIAALFAATSVYGRFSQDNELMACRASGIATLSVLAPALWLAGIVSVITLVLSLYVAPRLLWVSQTTIKANLRNLANHRLKTQGFIRWGERLIHVDRIDSESGWAIGLVAMDLHDIHNARVLVASQAKVDFSEVGPKTYAQIDVLDTTGFTQSGEGLGIADEQRLRRGESLELFEDSPRLYDWERLCRTWVHPEENRAVQDEVVKIRHQVCVQDFYRDVLEGIRAEGRYTRLAEYVPPGSEAVLPRIELHATYSQLRGEGRELVVGRTEATPETAPATRPVEDRGVEVTEYIGNRARRHFWARTAVVKADWDEAREAVLATVILQDVNVREVDDPVERFRHQDQRLLGPYAMPAEIAGKAESVELEQLYETPPRYGESIQRMVQGLDKYVVKRLLAKVQAEIHHRLAYSLSCLLMVLMGAALGLLLRGGQMLAAFAISAIPGSVVIVMLLMGRQMIANPGVPAIYGVAIIWGGVAAMTVATLYIYAVPLRR